MQHVGQLAVAYAGEPVAHDLARDHSIGATAQNEWKAAGDRNLATGPVRAKVLSATTSPMPSSSVRVLPQAATASLSVGTASAMRRSSRAQFGNQIDRERTRRASEGVAWPDASQRLGAGLGAQAAGGSGQGPA